MGKSDQRRIDDTITAIRNSPHLMQAIRNDIANLCTTQFPRLTLAEQQVYHGLSQDLSVKGKIGAGVAKGSAAERETRRAIFLIWKAIAQRQGQYASVTGVGARAAAAMTMGTGMLNAALSDAMLKAAVVASSIGAQYIFNELRNDPVGFVTAHKILIKGSTAGDKKLTGADGDYENVMTFQFQYDAYRDKFEVNSDKMINPNLGASHAFQTVSVPAVYFYQVPGFTDTNKSFAGVRGIKLTGADFMLTTQFTGCAFSWTKDGGVIRASHIAPSDKNKTYPGEGNGLARRLVSEPGRMANANNQTLAVFGRGAGNAPVPAGNSHYPDAALQWASIFGVQRGGNWKFYLQAVNQTDMIVEHRQIY
jgi:hypothetical protein